jgi:protein-disulfide isomerase
MHKIWLAVAAFCLAMPLYDAAAAGAATPEPSADDHVLGKSDAPITIIEYASLTCPHCAEFDRDTLPEITKNWIDTGKARLIYRDYPLDGLAMQAAMLAHCAPPDRYFGFVNELFHSQLTWARSSEPKAALERIAKLGGIGGEQFQKCLSDEAMARSIGATAQAAQKDYGVDSTPTFFINGTKIEGALPYDAFDKALAAAQPKS